MARQQGGMPLNLVRRTSLPDQETGDPENGQGDADQQGRGGATIDQGDDEKPAKVKRPRGKTTTEQKKKTARDIKVVNVPSEICKLLDLEAIETDRTASEVVVALLKRHLPNRYTAIRGANVSGDSAAFDQEPRG
jgi:hypothetical protein